MPRPCKAQVRGDVGDGDLSLLFGHQACFGTWERHAVARREDVDVCPGPHGGVGHDEPFRVG